MLQLSAAVFRSAKMHSLARKRSASQADNVGFLGQSGKDLLTVSSSAFDPELTWEASRVEEDLVDQLFNSSEKRLARTLLLLANFGKEGEPEPILAKISQETLADIIGTTRSRVSFFMNKFRRLGLISYNGRIVVHRSLLNVVLHEKPEIDREDKLSA
jgi:CRP-like cAMP-binding protein